MMSGRASASRRVASGLDPFVVVAVALGLLLFAPLVRSGLPQAPDGILHLYRTALWRWAWDDGVLWPRWHTLLFQGYGYSALNFNGPLPYVIAGLLSYLLPTLLAAYKGMVLLACLSYPVGMYLWARDILGPWGALVAAAAYTFAPFRFRELYFLGGYAQFLAWSRYPWVLFFFHRLARQPGRAAFLGAVASLAGLILAHNSAAMLFAFVLGVYLLGLLIVHRKRRTRAWLIGAAACALVVSAVFWLPALGEMPNIRVKVLTQGDWDVKVHMLRLGDFFAPSPPLDGRAVNPPLPFNFGRLPLVLAGLGALTLLRPSPRRLHRAFAMAVALVSSIMMLPVSLPVWRTVPLINFAEYPFRLYGCATLGMALLAGASLLWIERWARAQRLAAMAAVLGLIVAMGVYQFPRPFWAVTPTPANFLRYETAFRAMGTTAGGEFISKWVTVMPREPAEPAVTPELVRKALVGSPPGVSAVVMGAKAESLRLMVMAQAASTVTVAQFYYPGWRGRLDGEPVNLRPSAGTGLIQLDVPAGQHDLRLEFGDTPLRATAGWISVAGLLATMVLAWRLRSQRVPPVPGPRGQWPEAAMFLSLLGAVFLLAVLWIGPHTSWFRLSSPPGQALPAQHRTNLAISPQVALIGYTLDRAIVRPGDKLHVRLYWQAQGPLDRDFASFVKLGAGSEGQVFAQSDHLHPGEIPTTTWTGERYVVDDHFLRVPSGVPAVAMRITAGLYRLGELEGPGSVELPEPVHVLPRRPFATTGIDRTSASRLGDGIRLLGHRVDRTGDTLRLTLYWQADQVPAADYQVFVHALGPDGRDVAQADGPPVGGLYPTSAWLPGQVIADTHEIPLPAGAQPATLQVGLYDLSSFVRLPARHLAGAPWPDDAVVIPLD